MSNWREQLSEESESKAVAALLYEYYHYPALVFLIVFAFWNRIRNWSNFVVDGTVYFSGNEPWYHLRSTQYVVDNNLATMPFDPWTYFPVGTSNAQFGTLFDQLIGFSALVVGLGNPSESLVRHIVLIAPAFFALALCIPAYVIGRRLGGRFGGIATVAFIAFAPDRLLRVSIAGFTDHHVAEALFMSIAILGVMVALTVAQREKPVYELLAAGEIEALRGTIGWSILAGIAMSLYIWTWAPGVWIFGILGAFFVVHLSFQHLRGQSPEHAAFVGSISLLTAGVLQLSAVQTLEISATARSILHPVLAFAVAGGVVFMAWLSREVEQRDDVPAYAYPGAVFGLILGGAVIFALVLPDTFGFFVNQVDRVLGFITPTSSTGGTIAEFQPPDNRLDYLYSQYHFAAVTAAIGALIVLVRQTMPDRAEGQELLVLVWAAFMVSATFTQARFGYYLTIPVGALNAVLVGFLMKTLGSATDQDFSIETYQVLTVAMVLLVMFVPLLGVPWIGADNTAVEQADAQSRAGDVLAWDNGLDWMSENTPQPGQYGNADGDPMERFGTFDRTDDYDYPDGSYGVLSWWDYGHWITAQGERIPNANPFQQGATDAAYFLLAQNETEALDELEQRFDENENAQTRYVTIDWKMAETEGIVNGKYFAPIQFHNDFQRGDFFERLYLSNPEEIRSQRQLFSQSTMAQRQPYYNSMTTRLYHYHGSRREPDPIGVQRGGLQQGQNPVQAFDNVSAAREWAQQRTDRTVGGIGLSPEEPVPALEHFRLVHMNNVSAVPSGQGASQKERQLLNSGVGFQQSLVAQRDAQLTGLPRDILVGSNPAWTKTFERVPGATIEGTGPANEELVVSVPIKPENGNEFTYRQHVETDSNGEFTTTVPYATEGYDQWGVDEGYTDTNVRANGSYTIQTDVDLSNINIGGEELPTIYRGTVDVTEGQVIGEDDSVAEVTLEEEPLLERTDGGSDEQSTDDGTTDGGNDQQDGNQTQSIRTALP
jgi:dolichyl-diphosphooligosaccharide--protein glycosyltransferase